MKYNTEFKCHQDFNGYKKLNQKKIKNFLHQKKKFFLTLFRVIPCSCIAKVEAEITSL